MKAVFLDRDGTVNVEFGEGKINGPDKMVLLPNSLEALTELAKLDYGVFFVTNQLGIARGNYSEERFYCPHDPNENCDCRKPKPGMLLRAAEEFDVDLAQSWMVGDRLTDVGAGRDAGTKTILLSETKADGANYVAKDLLGVY